MNYDLKVRTEYNEGFEQGYKQALEEINTPTKPIIEKWDPSRCPQCEKSFDKFEPCSDGYYKRATALERCYYCGQSLDWSGDYW